MSKVFFLTLGFVIVVGNTSPAFASKCGRLTLEQHKTESALVFTGRVIKSEFAHSHIRTSFDPIKIIKSTSEAKRLIPTTPHDRNSLLIIEKSGEDGTSGFQDGVIYEVYASIDHTSDGRPFLTTSPCRNRAINVDNEALCKAEQGTWERFGLMEKDQCNLPALDAFAGCSDGGECISGACVAANGEYTKETGLAGRCYEKTVTLGTCLVYVHKGQADKAALCVD